MQPSHPKMGCYSYRIHGSKGMLRIYDHNPLSSVIKLKQRKKRRKKGRKMKRSWQKEVDPKESSSTFRR